MDTYDIETYGEQIAEIYDQMHSSHDESAISTLTQLAGNGPVLELGIGTGRIALPLAKSGLEVHGIDASVSMISKLRAKPGGESIPVTMGNFADINVDKEFSLIFVVFNTFFTLLTQKEQLRCFRNVSSRLSKEGVFLLEAFVPDLTRFDRGQNISVTNVTTESLRLDVSLHDPVEQRVNSHHMFISGDGTKLYPIQIRYAWPSELDLMAELAGLSLRSRWSGWQRETFTATSEKHISVYGRTTW